MTVDEAFEKLVRWAMGHDRYLHDVPATLESARVVAGDLRDALREEILGDAAKQREGSGLVLLREHGGLALALRIDTIDAVEELEEEEATRLSRSGCVAVCAIAERYHVIGTVESVLGAIAAAKAGPR